MHRKKCPGPRGRRHDPATQVRFQFQDRGRQRFSKHLDSPRRSDHRQACTSGGHRCSRHAHAYEPMVFDAFDTKGSPIYRTNVLMCIATDFVLIGLNSIPDESRRAELVRRFEDSGREVIALSDEQVASFGG